MCDGLDEQLSASDPGAGVVKGGPKAMCDGSDDVLDRPARALLAPPAGSDGRAGPCPKPLAVFLTQLLACRDGDPAYRSRRRAEPDFASAAYGSAGGASGRAGFDRVL